MEQPTSKPTPVGARLALFATIGVIVVGAIYALAMLFDLTPFNTVTYIGLMATLVLTNVAYVYSQWRMRDSISYTKQVAIIVWFLLVVWFWGFAGPYFLIVQNLDSFQERISVFAFIWEVCALGGSVVMGSVWFFRPIQRYYDSGKKATKQELEKLYKYSMRYPLFVSFFLFCASVIGYTIGTWQQYFFANMSSLEVVKNLIGGFVSFVFVSLMAYVILSYILDPIRAHLRERSGYKGKMSVGISWRLATIFGIVVIGAMLLMQLVVIQSIQSIIRSGLETTLRTDIAEREWLSSTVRQEAHFARFDAATLAKQEMSPETLQFISSQSEGVVHDLRYRPKLIGFFIDPETNVKSGAILYLDTFYEPLWNTILPITLGGFFILLASIVITISVSQLITRSMRDLTSAIRALEKNRDAALPRVGSGDEIEELANALSFFVIASQKADKAKDEFITVASHQLRTPISAIKWTLDLLKTDATKEQKEILQRGESGVHNMEKIAEGLLLSARSREGVSQRNFAMGDIGEALKRAVTLVEPLAEHKDISITTDIEPGLPQIWFDAESIEWAIQNLLDNAVKYTPAGGAVELRATVYESAINISVKDTGIGMTPEDQKHLFEKFFRAEEAVKLSPDGSGLGLSIVKVIVESHGGTVSVESEFGKGSTFTCSLPINFVSGKA